MILIVVEGHGSLAEPRRAVAPGRDAWALLGYGQPWANLVWKQMKSETLRIGGVVELSQLA